MKSALGPSDPFDIVAFVPGSSFRGLGWPDEGSEINVQA